MTELPQTDPTVWGALGASLTSLGASVVAFFKSRDTNERIHRANGKAQEAINRVAVNEEAIRGIRESLTDIKTRQGRIEDKLDRVLEDRS